MVKNVALTSCIILLAGMIAMPASSQTVVSTATNTSPKKKPQEIPTFIREASEHGMVAGIRVKVNGALINFGNGEPVEADGRILVPMRGVFEALGADVKYDVGTQTIHAVRGATTIAIRPGDESAQVNGETRPLEAPAQIVNGSAVVPLRFVSEAFGAKVKWNPETSEVTVNTAALPAMKLPAAPQKNTVVGMLTGVFPEAKMITVRMAGGTNVRVPLTYDVSATRRTIGNGLPINATTASAPIFSANALNIGEQVQVEMNDEGEGVLVLVNTDLRRGEIKSIEPLPTTGGAQVTLTDGSVITMIPDPLVRFQNRPVTIDTIKPAEQVVIRLNDKGEGAALAVLTAGATNMIPPLPGAVSEPVATKVVPAASTNTASSSVSSPNNTPVSTPRTTPGNTVTPPPAAPTPEPEPDRPPA